MSQSKVVVRIIPYIEGYTRALRAAQRSAADLRWAILYGRMTDEEQLALRWARTHVHAGRTDLAEEDLAWLGRRLAA